MEKYNTWSFFLVSIAQKRGFWDSLIILYWSGVCYFLRLSNILLNEYVTLLYPLICWWSLSLFFPTMNKDCYEYSFTYMCPGIQVHFHFAFRIASQIWLMTPFRRGCSGRVDCSEHKSLLPTVSSVVISTRGFETLPTSTHPPSSIPTGSLPHIPYLLGCYSQTVY